MIEATKLTEKSAEVFEYVKNAGGKVSVPELAQALGRSERSIGANLTDLKKKGFGEREKVEVEGEERRLLLISFLMTRVRLGFQHQTLSNKC